MLPTPSGLLVWELYSRGVRIGVSSRSWASLVELEGGGCRVADDMSLITFDFVVDPSNNGAFLLPMTARFRRGSRGRGPFGGRGGRALSAGPCREGGSRSSLDVVACLHPRVCARIA